MIIYILLLIILILSIPYIVDICVNGVDLVKRLKIGRHTDIDNWYSLVETKCKQWIIKTPTIKKTDNSRLIIFDMLKGRYKNSTIQSWQTGLLYCALEDNENMKLFVDENGEWKSSPTEVDYALLAYGILKNSNNVNHIKPAMDKMYNLIFDMYQENDGCIPYRKGISHIRFVDTVGFISAFLALYGKTYKEEKAIELAKHVLLKYYEEGFHKDMLLPIHAYDSLNKNPLGMYGWGRGAGWYLLGIIDTYLETSDEDLKTIIEIIANKYVDYLKEDGSFSWHMQLKSNADSSITSICAYFYANCYRIFDNNHYFDVSSRCLKYLMTVTRRNGEIDFSQGDTKGIGSYSLTYNIMPFTQGMSMRAYKTLYKKGR